MSKFFKNLRKLLKIISNNKISSKQELGRKSCIADDEIENLLNHSFAEKLIRTRERGEYYITTLGRREYYTLLTIRSGKFWGIISIILAIVIFSLGTFYGQDLHDAFHNNKGVVVNPSEIEYLCLHNWMKKSISLTNYEDFPVEDYSLAFSWPIEEEVLVEKNYIEGSQNQKVLEIDFEYGDTMNKAFIIPSMEPGDVLSIEVMIKSDCDKNFNINVAKSPIILKGFFAN